jgi:hypothetical protein
MIKKVVFMSIISQPIFSLIKRTPQYKAVIRLLAEISVDETLARSQNQASKGHLVLDQSSTDHYVIDHTIEDGIERVTFTPKQQIHTTSILLMHGMWHGAWCWQQWQAYFAEKGWQSVAFSLP